MLSVTLGSDQMRLAWNDSFCSIAAKLSSWLDLMKQKTSDSDESEIGRGSTTESEKSNNRSIILKLSCAENAVLLPIENRGIS